MSHLQMIKKDFPNWKLSKDGLGYEVENEIYHSSKGISSTDIKKMLISPLHYENKSLFKLSTDSLSKGSLYHIMVLEPHLIGKKVIKEEFEGCELNKNSNAYKEAKAKFLEKNRGKEIYSVSEWEEAERMANITKTICGALLDDIVTERAFCYFNEEFGEYLKIKVDALNKKGFVIDLKSTSVDVTNERDVQYAVIDYGYHISAAFYIDVLRACGVDVHTMVMIFQSTKAPNYCLPYIFSEEVIEIGRSLYRDALRSWVDYRDNGIANVAREFNLPDWYVKKAIAGEL